MKLKNEMEQLKKKVAQFEASQGPQSINEQLQ